MFTLSLVQGFCMSKGLIALSLLCFQLVASCESCLPNIKSAKVRQSHRISISWILEYEENLERILNVEDFVGKVASFPLLDNSIVINLSYYLSHYLITVQLSCNGNMIFYYLSHCLINEQLSSNRKYAFLLSFPLLDNCTVIE